jgi:hypothetical protein
MGMYDEKCLRIKENKLKNTPEKIGVDKFNRSFDQQQPSHFFDII